MDMYGFGFGHMYGWSLFGGAMMIVSWAVIILLAVLIIRALRGGRKGGEPERGGRAMDILKERYAKGEIGKEEYEAKKKDLQG